MKVVTNGEEWCILIINLGETISSSIASNHFMKEGYAC